MLRSPLRDLRHALRRLVRSPGFSLAAVAVLSLGIGAVTTIFGLVDALLLEPLPAVRDQGSLVNVHPVEGEEGGFQRLSWPDYRRLAEETETLAGLAAFTDQGLVLSTGGEAELVVGQVVSADYFDLLGVSPAHGRFFLPEEGTTAGAAPVVVLRHALWKSRFGGDPHVVGREVRLNGQPFTVVGVAPPGFIGTFFGFAFSLWIPAPAAEPIVPGLSLAAADGGRFELVARLAEGAAPATVRGELDALAERLAGVWPERWGERRFEVFPTTGLDDSLRGGVIGFLAVLFAIAALLLTLAAVNVAGMLLVRGVARGQELAVRAALGARRARLVAELMGESLVLFLAGAGGGLLVAAWATRGIESFDPPFEVPLELDLGIDPGAAAFAVAVAVVAGLATALLPALRASRPGAVSALRGEVEGGAGRRWGLMDTLVAGQVGLCLLLLFTAGLFVRSVAAVDDADPGFHIEGLWMADVRLSPLAPGEERARQLYDRLLQRVEALPGVESAALARRVPLGLGGATAHVALPGSRAADDPGLAVELNAVGEGWFSTLEVPLLAGRPIAARDAADGAPVAVVNRTLARRLWPEGGAVGRSLEVDGRETTVVGVAADGKYRRLWEDPRPHVWLAIDQAFTADRSIVVRAAEGAGPSPASALAREIRALDPDLPHPHVLPVADHAAIALLPQRLAASVTGALGVVGLVMAGIGLYGVLAFAVGRRRREIGVRMALGAAPRAVLARVLGRGVRLAAAGAVVGVAVSLVAARGLSGLLVGVAPTDPATLGAVVVILILAAAVASLAPAITACRVDPARALRQD